MKIRKIIALLIIGAMLAAALGGCGEKTEEEDKSPLNGIVDETSDDSGDISSGEEDEASEGYYSTGLDEKGFFKGVTASEIVTLPEYKGITVSAAVLEPDLEELQEQLEQIAESYAYYEQITDRAVEDGDTINIDYVGSVDGVEFAGGNTQGAGTTVTIGVTQYIDDFLEQLIGHMPGENFDIEVTFPDPYQNNTDLSGKDAVFNITINYIQGDEIIPEIDDTIATYYGFDTAEELIEDIKNWIVEEQVFDFVDTLLEDAVCEEIPQAVMDHYRTYMESYYEDYAVNYYNIDIDTFLSAMGYESFDDLFNDSLEDINAMAVNALAYQAIAEIEGLDVTENDISAYELESYVPVYGKGYICQYLLGSYIVPNYIIDNAVIE